LVENGANLKGRERRGSGKNETNRGGGETKSGGWGGGGTKAKNVRRSKSEKRPSTQLPKKKKGYSTVQREGGELCPTHEGQRDTREGWGKKRNSNSGGVWWDFNGGWKGGRKERG